jgi:hypothetical protein
VTLDCFVGPQQRNIFQLKRLTTPIASGKRNQRRGSKQSVSWLRIEISVARSACVSGRFGRVRESQSKPLWKHPWQGSRNASGERRVESEDAVGSLPGFVDGGCSKASSATVQLCNLHRLCAATNAVTGVRDQRKMKGNEDEHDQLVHRVKCASRRLPTLHAARHSRLT